MQIALFTLPHFNAFGGYGGIFAIVSHVAGVFKHVMGGYGGIFGH